MDIEMHVILFLVTNVLLFCSWLAWLKRSFFIFILLLMLTATIFEPTALVSSVLAIALTIYWQRKRNEKLARINSLLLKASGKGHLKYVNQLVSKGATEFWDALICAASKGHAEIVELLISLDGVSKLRSSNMWLINEALIIATKNGHLDVVKLILSKGPFDRGSLLCTAAKYGHRDVVEYLVSKEVGWDALESACDAALLHNNVDVFRFLAPILSKKPFDMGSFLRTAAGFGHIDILEYLVAKEVGWDALESACFAAIDYGCVDAVRILAPILAEDANSGFLERSLVFAKQYDDDDDYAAQIVEYLTSLSCATYTAMKG